MSFLPQCVFIVIKMKPIHFFAGDPIFELNRKFVRLTATVNETNYV